MSEAVFYRCEHCGRMEYEIRGGGGPVCCGQPMAKLTANDTDAPQEKHVPVAAFADGVLTVRVGSAAHPMEPDHFIEWVALAADGYFALVSLKPGEEPEARFAYTPRVEKKEVAFRGEGDQLIPNCEGSVCNFVYTEEQIGPATVYAYCNKHGLWQARI